MQLLINSEPKNIKKLIIALLKSKFASRVLAQDYVKSYIMIENKVSKTHHKILTIYTDKTQEQLMWFVNKTFANLGIEIL